MRRLLYSPRARDDLEDLWLTVARGSGEEAGDRWLDRVDARCRGLVLEPFAGRARDELAPGIRAIVVRPWVVFYRVTEDTVEVVRLLHGRRDAARLL